MSYFQKYDQDRKKILSGPLIRVRKMRELCYERNKGINWMGKPELSSCPGGSDEYLRRGKECR